MALFPSPAGYGGRGLGAGRVHLGAQARRRYRSYLSGGGARSLRPVSTNQMIRPEDVGGGGGLAGDQVQDQQGQHGGDDRAEGQVQRAAAADPGRQLGQGRDRVAAGEAGGTAAGTGGSVSVQGWPSLSSLS